jgi:hypothetical protein
MIDRLTDQAWGGGVTYFIMGLSKLGFEEED